MIKKGLQDILRNEFVKTFGYRGMIRANEFVEMLNSLLEVGHPVNMDKLSLLFSNNYNNKGNSNGRNNVNQSNQQEQGNNNKIIRKNKVHIDFFFVTLRCIRHQKSWIY